MTATPARVAVRAEAACGEGPVWDPSLAAVHWVDIIGGAVHTTQLESGSTSTRELDTMVGAVAPCEDGGFVTAVTAGFGRLDGDVHDIRLPILPAGQRMNDAKCDPRGRFWSGSCDMDFASGQGRLWVLDEDWTARVVLDGLTQPNGMGWSPDGSVYYLIDTAERMLFAFDVDLASGALGERRVLRRFDGERGLPDGLSVDASGGLWVAMWSGARILRLNAGGETVEEIAVPLAQPTSCAFVGARRDRLWVTSAREGASGPDAEPGLDGSILELDARGAVGVPVAPFAGRR